MAENNGGGIPIITPPGTNGGSTNLDSLKTAIETGTKDIIEAIKDNGSGNGSSRNNRTKTEAEKQMEKFATEIEKITKQVNRTLNEQLKADENLKKIQEIRDISRRGSEEERKAAKRFLELRQAEIEAYENNIKKQKELEAKKRVLEQTEIKLNEERIALIERESSATDSEELDFIDKRLEQITEALKDVADEQKNNADQLKELADDRSSQHISEELRNTATLINRVHDNTSSIVETVDSIDAEQRKENKRKEKQKKIDDARAWKLNENLSEAFDGGLFNLGDNLSKVFKEATQKHLEGTRSGIMGNLLAFGESTLFSMMDYQTNKLTEAITTLQSTFESTGISITQAIMVDRDEIAAQWADVANQLEEEGYGKALTVADFAQYEEMAAKAGVVNKDLMKTIAHEMGKTSATTGIGLPDLMSSESLLTMQQYYLEAINEGKSQTEALNLVSQILSDTGASISAAVDTAGSATGLAEGKVQETYVQSFQKALLGDGSVVDKLDQGINAFADAISVQSEMGKYVGGSSLYSSMIQSLQSLYEGGIYNDASGANLLSLLSGQYSADTLREAIQNGQYGDVLMDMLQNLKQIAGEGQGITSKSAIIKSVFGFDASEYLSLESGSGGIDKLIADIENTRSQARLGTESEAYQKNKALVTEGRTVTVEQGLKNRAINDMAGAWAVAEESGIPEASKQLISAINATNSGIQSAISFGVETLISFLGSKFTGSIGSLLFGGASGAAGAAAGGGGGLAAISGSLSGIASTLGPVAIAAAGAFAVGKTIASFIDDATENMVVTPSEDALKNLRDIEDENYEKNKTYQEAMQKMLEENNIISEDTKKVLMSDLDTIVKNVTEEDDTKQSLGRTFKQKVEAGEIDIYGENANEAVKAFTGKDITELSDEEAAEFYLEHSEDISKYGSTDTMRDLQIAEADYKSAKGKRSFGLVDDILTNYAADGLIQAYESEAVSKELGSIMVDQGLSAIQQEETMNALGQRIREINDNYTAYSAAGRIRKYILDTLDELRKTSDYTSANSKVQAETETNIINDIKNGTYDGMSSELIADLALAKDYLDFERSSSYEKVTNGLTLSDANAEIQNRYAPSNVSKFATGIDYVPYDNYLAYLHEGERVQTSAEARLDDLEKDIYYQNYNSNTSNTNNNLDDLTTTNSSIDSGFESTTSNQETIIEALKAILNALTNNNATALYNSNNAIFNDINNNKTALRGNNISRLVSQH